MKKLFICLLVLFSSSVVSAEQVTLQWDHDSGTSVDGFRLYQTTPNADYSVSFDYTNPVKFDQWPEGNIPADKTEVTFDVSGKPDEVLKYIWVLRAFRGQKESVDSNQVHYKVDNVKPDSAINLTATYDIEKEEVNLKWQQENLTGVRRWLVYYKLNEGEFNLLGHVSNLDGVNDLELIEPLELELEPGEEVVLTFAIVTYKSSGVYSANSEEVSVTVVKPDEEQPLPAPHLRFIEINIPVQ